MIRPAIARPSRRLLKLSDGGGPRLAMHMLELGPPSLCDSVMQRDGMAAEGAGLI